VIEVSGGGYLVVGQTKSASAGSWDIWVLRVSESGGVLWSDKYGGTGGDDACDVVAALDGNYLVGANSWSWAPYGRYDFLLLSLEGTPAAAGVTSPGSWAVTAARPSLAITPNPAGAVARARYQLREAGPVSLRIYDVAGRLVSTPVDGWQEAGAHEVPLDVAALTSRICFARLETEGASATAKFVRIE
jgi:hypothetical protein